MHNHEVLGLGLGTTVPKSTNSIGITKQIVADMLTLPTCEIYPFILHDCQLVNKNIFEDKKNFSMTFPDEVVGQGGSTSNLLAEDGC